MSNSSKNIQKSIKIAESIIKAQGYIFIKELLREKKNSGAEVKIGRNKKESLENLLEAIREGHITYADLVNWVSDIEGWGKQHVYVFDLPNEFTKDKIYHQKSAIEEAINNTKYSKYLNSKEEYKFPKKLVLSHINTDHKNNLELIWQQRITNSKREEKEDPPNRVIEGDEYEFHAYRIIPARSITRFCIKPHDKIAAIFIQIPLGKEHNAAITNAKNTVREIFDIKELTVLNLSKVIKDFDNLDLNTSNNSPPKLEAHNTKFSSSGASIEFSADTHLSGWKKVTTVRRVRNSLDDKVFNGVSGRFNVHLTDVVGTKRTIQMYMDSKNNKIYFRAQMTSDEVWSLLNEVKMSALKGN